MPYRIPAGLPIPLAPEVMSDSKLFEIDPVGVKIMVQGFILGLGIIVFFVALGLAMGMPSIFFGLPHQ